MGSCPQLLDYKVLADGVDIDMPTAKNRVSLLEAPGIIFLLHPYSNNALKRAIEIPKVCSCGTGPLLADPLARRSALEHGLV